MTLYTHYNCQPGTLIIDMDTQMMIDSVMSVETDTGTIVCYHHPMRLNGYGEHDTFTLRYRTIHPIFAGYPYPCLFHCYGALQ